MKELVFSHTVQVKLGGISKVKELTSKVVTRGFDCQLYLTKSYKGCNLVKVTTENDKLEIMFYKMIPGKSLNKLKTNEIKSLDDLNEVLFNEIGLVF